MDLLKKNELPKKTVSESFTSIIKNGRIQLFLTLAGVLVALLNVWIASRIAPLGQDIAVVQAKISALENNLSDRPDLLQRFVSVETQVKSLNAKVDRMDNKLDKILDREVSQK